MIRRFLAICAVLGMSFCVSGAVGCSGSDEAAADKTPPPTEGPTNEEATAELPPDA